MKYPEYRRAGLPVSSSMIESLIKEINFRVKGTEKFWNRPEGAEQILQVRRIERRRPPEPVDPQSPRLLLPPRFDPETAPLATAA